MHQVYANAIQEESLEHLQKVLSYILHAAHCLKTAGPHTRCAFPFCGEYRGWLSHVRSGAHDDCAIDGACWPRVHTSSVMPL
jgi:hypothetical protein